MTRTLHLIALLAPLATGCILYEERYPVDDVPCVEGEDCDDAGDDDDDDGVAEPEPEPEPGITEDLALTVREGQPGQTLLSTLIPLSQDIDLDDVVAVRFARDVEVVDSIARPFEIVLVLTVAAHAALGDVEVSVETADGPGWVLDQPFRVIAPDGTTPTCTGGSTTDTGC